MNWTLKDFQKYIDILSPTEKARLTFIVEALAHDNYPADFYLPDFNVDDDDFWRLHRN